MRFSLIGHPHDGICRLADLGLPAMPGAGCHLCGRSVVSAVKSGIFSPLAYCLLAFDHRFRTRLTFSECGSVC